MAGEQKYGIAFRVVDYHIYKVEAKDFEEAKKKAQKLADEHENPDRIVDGGLVLDEESCTFE